VAWNRTPARGAEVPKICPWTSGRTIT
jgi:hypothetical protein